MHIQLQHSFFSPIKGGQERRMHALAKELLSRGHRVSILVSKDGIDSVERYQKLGIDSIVHPNFFSDGWRALINPYLYTRRLKTFLIPVYSRNKPDLVLSFNIFYVAATKRVCPELPVAYLTGEQLNWGLVTHLDNAYDGHEPSAGSVPCSAPLAAYTCGGESVPASGGGTPPFGDLITPVKTANALWLSIQ